MKLTVDHKCAGHALCNAIAPELFELDEQGIAQVTNQPDAGQRGLAEEAAQECPAAAILIERGAGDE